MTGRSRSFSVLCSLAMFALVAALWVRSQVRIDTVHLRPHIRPSGFSECVLQSWAGNGGVMIRRYRYEPGIWDRVVRRRKGDLEPKLVWKSKPFQEHMEYRSYRRNMWYNRRFVFDTETNSARGSSLITHTIRVPYWCLSLPFLVSPALWVRKCLRARVRARRGLCIRCGYDLRETPGRCPECGSAAGVAAADAGPKLSAA